MKIGLFFGSFNPIHAGHLMLAEGVLNESDLQQVWFVVTPHNPTKKKGNLLADHHRLNMVRDSIRENIRFRASDIEFGLTQPNYTAITLTHLKERYKEHEFSIIMGEDNLRGLSSWYNADYILNHHRILVYPRKSKATEEVATPTYTNANVVCLKEAPVLDLSSSQIRQAVKLKKSIKYLVPQVVEETIIQMGFYK